MAKKSKPSKNMKLYSNLASSRKAKKEDRLRKKAQYKASLPKHPVKRFFYRLHPKRVAGFVFSKEGLLTFLKIFGVLMIVGIAFAASVFAYYRQDLKKINASDLTRKIQTTVNEYYDRHGKLLWEDKGDGDYKLVVKSESINKYVKDATVAIEDKSFYEHHGVSLQGIVRALVNNLKGGSTQGGSTLTQQLVKQVFLAEEAYDRSWGGVPRKIKEAILATEIERMYTKDEILTLYLNESSYGGRRNGVESGAQAYFNKSSKDLTLPEAALLASIPNQPYLYDPWNTEGNEYLIARQRYVLDQMVETGAITKEEAEEAKKFNILATVKREQNSLEDIKAPHFVLEVRDQLENQLGMTTVRAGGLKITTTLDLEAQKYAEQAVAAGAKLIGYTGADNLSMSSIDVDTGQVIAMVGSVNFSKAGYGQRNASTSLLEPGSSIKPVADYIPLFMEREGVNYGPGSILRDENIDSLYCAGSVSNCTLQNYTRGTYGNVTIRKSLGSSLNRPAVKAMYIAGTEQALKINRELGNISYCADAEFAGLSSAIGGGCRVRQVEHTNAFASIARGGSYKPITYILEVKNSSNEQLLAWKNAQGKRVVDPQTAYMVTDILADPTARSLTFGAQAYSFGFVVDGVWTASKTGTTENGRGQAKDSWMMGYSSKIATGVWSGNHDGRPMASSDNSPVRRVMNDYMYNVHHSVYAKQGKWKSGDKIAQPEGLKRMTVMGQTDIWPSWFNQSQIAKGEKMTFDKVSKKLATDCTPPDARVEVTVTKMKDPITKKDVVFGADGYDATKKDDVHKCNDAKPSVNSVQTSPNSITVNLSAGTHPLTTATVAVAGQTVFSGNASSTLRISHNFTASNQTISVTVRDRALYSSTQSFMGPNVGSNDDDGETPPTANNSSSTRRWPRQRDS